MKTKNLETLMRRYEADDEITPGAFYVVRLDGRKFSKLTAKLKHNKPFDLDFFLTMREVTRILIEESGFKVLYGYHESDEISLLMGRDEETFNRRRMKITSVFASLASSVFTLRTGEIVSFDARISVLPTETAVVDYFQWRLNDSVRNCLNAYCFWQLVQDYGYSPVRATTTLNSLGAADRNELLFQNGINFNDVPAWQKRGSGYYWVQAQHTGYNPKTNEQVQTIRKRLIIDEGLPYGDEYSKLILDRIRNLEVR